MVAGAQQDQQVPEVGAQATVDGQASVGALVCSDRSFFVAPASKRQILNT